MLYVMLDFIICLTQNATCIDKMDSQHSIASVQSFKVQLMMIIHGLKLSRKDVDFVFSILLLVLFSFLSLSFFR